MQFDGQGFVLRSEQLTHSAGSSEILRLNFLEKARAFSAPEVTRITIKGTFNVTADASGLTYEDAKKFLSRIRIRDEGGDFYDLSGAETRLVEQMELGDHYKEAAAIGASASDTAYDVYWNVFFRVPRRALRGRDFAVPLHHFLAGGELELGYQNPSDVDTLTSGAYRVYFHCREARTRELKTRMEWRSQAMENIERAYPIHGVLRAALIGSNLATTGYSSLATITEIDSRTLNWPRLDTDLLRDQYLYTGVNIDDDNDEVRASNVIPLVLPSTMQRTTQLQSMDTLHIDQVVATVTSQRLITCVLKPRHVPLAALVLGHPEPALAAKAIKDHGKVVAQGKANRDASLWDRQTRSVLPIRVDPR